jgi:hypothetical protein
MVPAKCGSVVVPVIVSRRRPSRNGPREISAAYNLSLAKEVNMAKFSDVYQDTGGLSFVSEDEKEALVESKSGFPALRVYRSEGQWGPKYNIVTVLPGEDEEKVISFGAGSVDSRDRFLDNLIRFMEETEDAETTVLGLTKKGRSWILVDLAVGQ